MSADAVAGGVAGNVNTVGNVGTVGNGGGSAWWRRIPVAVLAISGLQLGLWIGVAPQSFYDSFPGGGSRWVSAFPPYNEHLLRDFGAMNVAIGLLALVATVRFDRMLVRAACGVWFVFGVQHLLFHLAHADALTGVDRWASPGALVFVLATAVAGWFLAPPAPLTTATGARDAS